MPTAAGEPQSHPDFTGRWILDAVGSKLQVSTPDSATFLIEHKEPEFRFERTHIID